MLTILFTVVSQLLIKWIVSSRYTEVPKSLYDKSYYIAKVLLDPYMVLAILLVFFSGVCWVIAMTKFELSNIYPLVIAGLLVLTSFLSIILFGESITTYKITGIVIILFGSFVLYKGF